VSPAHQAVLNHRTDDKLDGQIALYEPRLKDGHGEVVLEVHPPLAASRVTSPVCEGHSPRLVAPRVQGAVELQLLEEDGSLACGLSLCSQ
jgi:hypothetical protein